MHFNQKLFRNNLICWESWETVQSPIYKYTMSHNHGKTKHKRNCEQFFPVFSLILFFTTLRTSTHKQESGDFLCLESACSLYTCAFPSVVFLYSDSLIIDWIDRVSRSHVAWCRKVVKWGMYVDRNEILRLLLWEMRTWVFILE